MQPSAAPSSTRRGLLRAATALGLGVVAIGVSACQSGGQAVCSDPDKLTDAQIAVRSSFEYVEKAPDPGKACAGCAFFLADAAGACGACDLLKGPVNSAGHCSSWSARKTA